MEVMAFPDRTKTKASKGWSAGQLQALDFRFEARAKDRRVERVLEAITYECRIFIFDIQIELADVEAVMKMLEVGLPFTTACTICGPPMPNSATSRRCFNAVARRAAYMSPEASPAESRSGMGGMCDFRRLQSLAGSGDGSAVPFASMGRCNSCSLYWSW